MASPLQAADRITSGQLDPAQTAGDFNRVSFLISQALAKLQTATLVKVVGVTNNGGLSPVGFVDVTPLVNQVDKQGIPTEHATIFNVPYFRLQGGANAVIIDPVVGDIGMAAFASRDISKVKSTKGRANPGSFRQYNFADGMYFGGLLNGTPSQYIQFSAAGIKIHSPAAVILDAPDVQITAATVEINATTSTTVTTPTFTVNGTTVLNGGISQTGGGAASFSGSMSVTGDVTAEGTSVHNHIHTSNAPGTPTSAPL